MRQISLLIIAGVKSSRLGEDKRFVEVGGEKLLEKILKKASEKDFGEIFLCVEENLTEIKNCGPIAAISNGLQKISNE